jgi:hypothetical protein
VAKATAAKRAKKPKPVTKKQLAALRGEQAEEKTPRRRYGILTVLQGEHMNCPVPVERSDLYVGQKSFEQPHRWGTLTFRLVSREGKLHTYQEVRNEP